MATDPDYATDRPRIDGPFDSHQLSAPEHIKGAENLCRADLLRLSLRAARLRRLCKAGRDDAT